MPDPLCSMEWKPYSIRMKQPAGLPDEDRGFTGELSAFSFACPVKFMDMTA